MPLPEPAGVASGATSGQAGTPAMPTPIPYDPTNQALYRPEARPPLAMRDDWSIDAIAAEFSRLAYRRFEQDGSDKGLIAEAIGAVGYRRPGWFREATGTATFSATGFAAVHDDGRAIIAFRGTQADSFRDVMTDASFILENWDRPGRVRSGFSASLSSVLEPILGWLRDMKPERLLLTGHSLGAALATLLAARLSGWRAADRARHLRVAAGRGRGAGCLARAGGGPAICELHGYGRAVAAAVDLQPCARAACISTGTGRSMSAIRRRSRWRRTSGRRIWPMRR